MEQHPIPRQITTFEFKLIGFLTIKQFLYIIFFVPIGFIVYSIFPIPILNILLGVIVGGFGFALGLMPINDRPLDLWVKSMIKRLTSPTQYVYHKHNDPVYFFNNLYFVSDPHRVLTHIESQEKLAAYLASTQTTVAANPQKQNIHNLFHLPKMTKPEVKPAATVIPQVTEPSVPNPPSPVLVHATQLPPTILAPQAVAPPAVPKMDDKLPPKEEPKLPATPQMVSSPKTPFFTGVVKNHRLIPIPGILIYVKDETGKTLRLLKTNPHGIFATFNVLPPGEYQFELKDPRSTYFFDTMKLSISETNHTPLEFFSKELL